MATAYLRGVARDEGRRPAESGGAPAAVPVPPIPHEAQDAPMDDGAGVRTSMGVIEMSRKRSAEDAGHETDDAGRGGVQPDPGSMAALAEAYSSARFQQRAGAFGLSAGVAMDLRMGWDLGLEADKVKARKRLSVEKPNLLILSPMCLAFPQWQALNTTGITWSLLAVWQNRRSSEVDAFSSNTLGRRRRGMNRARKSCW